MKNLKQLIKEFPSKKIVFAFGRFQPPTTGHELLVNAVKKIAAARAADHVIFASRTQDKKSNPLSADRKVYYLKRMFPKTNFAPATDSTPTFIQVAAELSKKYKHLVMVAGSDRIAEYKKILDKYNGTTFKFDTIEVVSAGERDPDSEGASGMSGTKMREAAKRGDFDLFKRGLPHSITELDGKRLMNEIRQGMGVEAVKEQVKFETNEIREKYHAGEIYNIGDRVTDGASVYEIVDRGANYISVVNETGDVSKKWLEAVSPFNDVVEDVQPGPAPEQITYKGYTTKNFNRSADAAKAFADTIQRSQDPVAILNALKATDAYMGINDSVMQGDTLSASEKEAWIAAHEKARESLNRIGEFMHHEDYWHMHMHELEGLLIPYSETGKEDAFGESFKGLQEMKFSPADKIKVARIIATALGVEGADEKSGAEAMVDQSLRSIKSKRLTPEAWKIIGNMLNMASTAGIKYDTKIIKIPSMEESIELEEAHKLGDKVIINKGPKDVIGKTGRIGEIRHGLHKTAEKTYTIDHDKGSVQLKSTHFKALKEETEKEVKPVVATPNVGSGMSPRNEIQRKMKVRYRLGEESIEEPEEDDLDDDEIEKMVSGMKDDDYLEAYDDEELGIIDDETGEHISDLKEEVINEVLSRAERIRAKVRFAKSEAKRERRTRVALKTRSSNTVINTRARRLAVNLMKQRLAKKPLDKLSVGEKERIEAIIQRRKAVISRIAMKLAPRVRKIENDRLTHKVYTKNG